MTFDQLKARWRWAPIRDCPGRFVLALPGRPGHGTILTPADVAGQGLVTGTFAPAAARDAVVVARLDAGGLISYRRRDGTYVHTLNTPEGFARKLAQLGIDPAGW